MTLSAEQANSLSPVKRALRALEDMQAKLDALEYAKREPIAIIGMGCRFPGGADSPEAFWRLLRDGVDAITEVPANRWDVEAYYDPDPDAPGKIYTRKGGFLTRVDDFNPQFFGISARETATLDPQQRLLLEVSWEALENANQAPDRLLNSSTGVFVGICSNDYNKMIWETGGAAQVDAFCATGNALSVAAGRLSYILGLKGPSLAVDTACSSSLVAVYLACQQLRQRECNMALAGGVHLLLSPESSVAFARTRMLDPDGYCKTFDATANGYVRGEGCGVIVLKRLSDALANKDNILAVIRGSAVNHNGRSSSLVAPNGPSQQALIRKALENGGVEPSQVSYVEVQGTGTALGQPIEVEALGAVFRKHRSPDEPLTIGSVKTNIGHLEAASGIASIIKVILALQHGEIPPHLHFKQPNPYINWDELRVKVPTERMPWTAGEKRRLAGVSAFGFSGTNAHVVLEEAPVSELVPVEIERPLHLLALSAKTEESLIQLAKQYEKYLAANPDVALTDICFTANTGRSHFQYRLSMLTSTSIELCEQLAAFSAGQEATGVFKGKAATNPKIAFLFTGEGSEYAGMGHQLYETQPTFRKTLDHCQEILRLYLARPLLEILCHALDQPAYDQPALFALEYALFLLWKSWGIEPAAVMGYGVGEYVAACVAGVFSLEDGLKLIAQRGRLMQVLPQDGEIEKSNGSPVVETALGEFEQVAKEVTYSQPQIPLVFNLTGELATFEIATPGYWCHHAQQSVAKFTTSMETLHQQECEIFLEVGAKPVLLEMGRQCLPEVEAAWLPSLNPERDDWQQLLESLAVLYGCGARVNWLGFDQDYSRRHTQLPTYPWQRQRYWIETAENRQEKVSSQDAAQTPFANLLNPGDMDKLTQQLKATGKLSEDELKLLPKLLELLANQQQQPLAETSKKEAKPASLRQLNTTPRTADDIQAWLVGQIAKELGVKPDDIDVRVPFDSYGLDSMLAISIASAGQQFLGIDVSPLLLMHYPTVELLSRHLAEAVEASGTEMFEI